MYRVHVLLTLSKNQDWRRGLLQAVCTTTRKEKIIFIVKKSSTLLCAKAFEEIIDTENLQNVSR